jgi:hypothetical protein
MGASETTRQTAAIEDAEEYFEPKLIELDLGRDQIEGQTLTQLRLSLDRINDLIAYPDSLGTKTITYGVGILGMRAEASTKLGALPVLLRRKKLILDRIGLLTGEQKVQDLRALAARADEPVRDELQAKLSELESEVRRWSEQAQVAENAQRKAELARQAELAKMELFERKSRVWQSFLERQSVASMLGTILLLSMFAYIALASGTGVRVPELVNNAFLVILGYFFGQSGSGSRSGNSP